MTHTREPQTPRARRAAALLAAAAALAGCDKTGDQPDAPPVDAGTAVAPPMEAQRAAAGVGAEGASLRNDDSMAAKLVTTPAKTYFDVKQRIVFEVQLPQAEKIFEATEGRKPSSHEEYMDKVVRANQIKLPRLPEGMEYVYHPDKGELWVEPVAGAGGQPPQGFAPPPEGTPPVVEETTGGFAPPPAQ